MVADGGLGASQGFNQVAGTGTVRSGGYEAEQPQADGITQYGEDRGEAVGSLAVEGCFGDRGAAPDIGDGGHG